MRIRITRGSQTRIEERGWERLCAAVQCATKGVSRSPIKLLGAGLLWRRPPKGSQSPNKNAILWPESHGIGFRVTALRCSYLSKGYEKCGIRSSNGFGFSRLGLPVWHRRVYLLFPLQGSSPPLTLGIRLCIFTYKNEMYYMYS